MCTIICTLCILFGPLSVTTWSAPYMCTFVYYSVHYAHNTTQFTLFARGPNVHFQMQHTTHVLYTVHYCTHVHIHRATAVPRIGTHIACNIVHLYTIRYTTHTWHVEYIRWPHFRPVPHTKQRRNVRYRANERAINKDEGCIISCPCASNMYHFWHRLCIAYLYPAVQTDRNK